MLASLYNARPNIIPQIFQTRRDGTYTYINPPSTTIGDSTLGYLIMIFQLYWLYRMRRDQLVNDKSETIWNEVSKTNQKALELRMTEEIHKKLSQDSKHIQFSFSVLWQWHVALRLITGCFGPRKISWFSIPLLIDIWLRYRPQVHKRGKKPNPVRHIFHKTKSPILAKSLYNLKKSSNPSFRNVMLSR
jgi:hypothetical protein